MHVSQEIGFIPDKDIELYFKAADVVVLPYTEIFQSGIAFLAYSFGLPVIATDVGSFREDIVEETTGFVCRPKDPDDLAATIDRYFDSPLYQHLDQRRQEIRRYAVAGHSWDAVAEITRKVYSDLLVTPV
jgi:glycosyltransferase involved in cell wall biosynthesis